MRDYNVVMRWIGMIGILLTSTAVFSSQAEPCSLTSTVRDNKVTITIPDGRKSFREGEIIPLALSFTSTADRRYWADNRNYDRSGRLDIETYCAEPAARDPLADYFSSGGFIGGGLGNEQQLSETPFTATADLNEWRQPGPGHYRLYVVSHRVWRPPDPGEATPYGRVSETLRSNVIEFDVTNADADWLAKQLQECTAAYQNATGSQQREAARRLRFLNTKQSAGTLAKLFWGLNDQPGGWDLMFGLFGSPHRAEAIAAMQQEINSPDHPITQEFLHTLTKLQITGDSSWSPPAYDAAHPEMSQEYWRKRQAHERELMQAAVAATAAALPQKVGPAHAQTVQALAESSDLLHPALASQMRKQLVAVWGELPKNTRLELIQYRWELIAGPDMLPLLVDFVSRPAPPFRTIDAMARDAALKHIYDLDPAQGRSLILRDVRDPKAQPSISLVKLLSSEQLQPVVQEAVERVEKHEARELDYHLLDLYGDESALAGVHAVFNDHLGQWGCEPQDAILRYFLRVSPEFGVNEVQASLAARKVTGCYRMLLQDMGKSLPKVEQVAIGALDDPDLEVANDATLALGRWGTTSAEPALWTRLKRFHQEWQGREGELRITPDYNSPVAHATALESTLVNSIATGTNWICGPEKLEQLRALASPRQQLQVETWIKEWQHGGAVINPNWFPEDQLSFGVLQYSNLDETQFRGKLSQMPAGTKFYFQVWKPGQISPPVSMERQEAVLQALRKHAVQYGVTIEEKSDP